MSLITPQSRQQGESGVAIARPIHIAPGPATTYADAKAMRRTVLASLTTFERALLWRWRIGVIVVYAGFFIALLATLVMMGTIAEPAHAPCLLRLPSPPEIVAHDFALTAGHRLTTSSLLVGTLNSAEALSIAVDSSGASRVPRLPAC